VGGASGVRDITDWSPVNSADLQDLVDGGLLTPYSLAQPGNNIFWFAHGQNVIDKEKD
jgi:hypothetical protein